MVEYRQSKGWTQEQAAARLQIPLNTLRGYECGTAIPAGRIPRRFSRWWACPSASEVSVMRGRPPRPVWWCTARRHRLHTVPGARARNDSKKFRITFAFPPGLAAKLPPKKLISDRGRKMFKAIVNPAKVGSQMRLKRKMTEAEFASAIQYMRPPPARVLEIAHADLVRGSSRRTSPRSTASPRDLFPRRQNVCGWVFCAVRVIGKCLSCCLMRVRLSPRTGVRRRWMRSTASSEKEAFMKTLVIANQKGGVGRPRWSPTWRSTFPSEA